MQLQKDREVTDFPPFRNKTCAWRRIDELEAENRRIAIVMRTLAERFKETVSTPRLIYLSIQQVRSGTIYIRWRKKGVNGDQKYLLMKSSEGSDFLLQQLDRIREMYQQFNDQALALNLAYSLRLNEIKRIKRYLDDLK